MKPANVLTRFSDRVDDYVKYRPGYPPAIEKVSLDNSQFFDFTGLKGRVLSASYAPKPDHPSHALMLVELERMFRNYANGDEVAFEYDTNMYFGQLK